jgi:hypothetical protein
MNQGRAKVASHRQLVKGPRNIVLKEMRVSIPVGLVLLAGFGCQPQSLPSECVEKNPKFVQRENRQLKNGQEWHCFDNGAWRTVATWKMGKKDGLSTEWHPNGQKKQEGTWKMGKKDGLSTHWHPNGQKSAEFIGEEVVGKYWTEDGTPQTLEQLLGL